MIARRAPRGGCGARYWRCVETELPARLTPHDNFAIDLDVATTVDDVKHQIYELEDALAEQRLVYAGGGFYDCSRATNGSRSSAASGSCCSTRHRARAARVL